MLGLSACRVRSYSCFKTCCHSGSVRVRAAGEDRPVTSAPFFIIFLFFCSMNRQAWKILQWGSSRHQVAPPFFLGEKGQRSWGFKSCSYGQVLSERGGGEDDVCCLSMSEDIFLKADHIPLKYNQTTIKYWKNKIERHIISTKSGSSTKSLY